MSRSGVFANLNLLVKPVLLVGLLCLGWHPEQAVAQSSKHDEAALASATRAGLARAGGGRVLSVERMQSGSNGLSRVKILDGRGRVQVYVIEDTARLSRNTPFEPEETGRVGRFYRAEPPQIDRDRGRDRNASPRMRARSGDIRERD